MRFEDGDHFGYRNEMILTILNLHVAPVPSTKFGLNLTWVPEQMWFKDFQERIDFSNSDSLCHSDASHQVSAQSNLWFERRCCLTYFKMAAMASILDIGTERLQQF